jgi:SRSO17 transposase
MAVPPVLSDLGLIAPNAPNQSGRDGRTANQISTRFRTTSWLLAEWPKDKDEPVKYWLSNLPTDTPLKTLVHLAKLRWRVEHDYRELKQCLGLDHYEGRTYTGLHHHLTSVTVAHAFLTCCRLARGDPDLARPHTAAA